jgi:hypothetical protein
MLQNYVMKTTLILNEQVHLQAKLAATRLGISLTKFIEEAIRLKISTDTARRNEPLHKLPVCSNQGGLRSGIDLDNTAELLDLLDQSTDPAKPYDSTRS